MLESITHVQNCFSLTKPKDGNKHYVRIFLLQELVFEQIEEEFAYTVIALLCDIGGTLGLLMGASVLTVCELLEVAWSRSLKVCCLDKPKKTDDERPIKTARVQPLNLHTMQQSTVFGRNFKNAPLFTKDSLATLEDAYFGDKIVF